MLHDEELYPAPNTFNPDRYKNMQDGLNMDPRQMAFGFGARMCPGRHLAQATIWAFIAFTLSVFDISPVIDEKTGLPMLPASDATSAMTAGAIR